MRADVDRPHGGGSEPLLPVGSGEPDDAETGAEALLGMRALIEDQGTGSIVAASLRMRSMVQPA